MYRFHGLRLLSLLSPLLLVGCSDSVTNTSTHTNKLDVGWAINPDGDLNTFFECLEQHGASLVSAHRGGPSSGFPENAIETMAGVLSHTPAIMEVDVATSSDGVLYLMHDDTLERTTTGAGAANSLRWNEIQKLRLKDNDGLTTDFRPSRFEDALSWAKGRTILQIDFKRSTRFEDVINEIDRQNAQGRVILIAYSLGAARKLHRLAPKTMISLSISSQSELNRAVAAGIPAHRLLGFTGTDDPRPRLFSILDGRDVEVIFGALGGRDSIDAAIARSGAETIYANIAADGADIIATDRPREASAALRAAGQGVENGQCGVTRSGD